MVTSSELIIAERSVMETKLAVFALINRLKDDKNLKYRDIWGTILMNSIQLQTCLNDLIIKLTEAMNVNHC